MPNFNKTKVDDSGMRSAANQIESDANAALQSFQRINEILDNSLFPVWEGPAKELFKNQYTADNENFKGHLNAIKNLNEKFREAIGIYCTAEERTGNIVNNIKI